MEFFQWAKKANQLMLDAGYDCLFNDEDLGELEEGNEVELTTFTQQDAWDAFLAEMSEEEFYYSLI